MTTEAERLNLTFSALSDPTRRKILEMLADGAKTVTELTQAFDISQPAVSKHLKVLERAGLVERSQKAQWRPARLQAAPLKEAADWVGRYRQHWEESFDRLDTFLRSIQSGQISREGEEDDAVRGS